MEPQEIMLRQKEALQNWANDFGLEIKSFIDGNRRKTQKYFLRNKTTSVSPSLTYSEMNIFLNGIYNCKKYNI